MGIQGAGKSQMVAEYVASGYARLNRDILGGKLDDLVPRLLQLLATGQKRVILDNTYSTRLSARRWSQRPTRTACPCAASI